MQVDSKRGDVYLKLADAHMSVGELREALAASVRAADLLPDNAVAQLRTGNLLLLAAQFDDAQARANRALAIDPKNAEAMVLLGNALVGLKELDSAVTQFQDAIALNPAEGLAYQSVAAVHGNRGELAQAEANFKKAIEVAPRSVSARLGLANFLWAARRQAEAEEVFKAAHGLDPMGLAVNRAMAIFYIASNRAKDAEPHVQALARTVNTPPGVLVLPDFYAAQRRYGEAQRILLDLDTRFADYPPVVIRLAAIDAHNDMRPKAQARLAAVIAKYPKEMGARLLSAHLHLIDGDRDQALSMAQNIVREEPASAVADGAYLIIGGILADRDRFEEAIAAYDEALKRQSPSQSVPALVALASLHLTMDELPRAEVLAQQAVTNEPTNAIARSVQIRIWLAQGQIASAKSALLILQKALPASPVVLNLTGAVRLGEGNTVAARAAYSSVLKQAPTNVEAITALVRMDLDAGRAVDALSRVDAMLETTAPSADVLLLAARANGAAGRPDRAEELLKRAIELAPARLQPYELLGRAYVASNRLDEAEKQYRQVVERNARSVAANTMLGLILEAQRRLPEAEKQYEHVLSLDSHAVVAANNLAWLYLGSDKNAAQALQLALVANAGAHGDPRVYDTLGWAYYRNQMYPQAVRYLELSVQKAGPVSPIRHYHLGMAHARVGNKEKARQHLKLALDSKIEFDGVADARQALGEIIR